MKTAQCPSCGASATNTQNCEFCGSLFVRAYERGFDLSNFPIADLANFSFSGLKQELDNNLSLRKKYDCDYFHTEVYPTKLDWLNLTTDDGLLRIHNLSINGVRQNNSLSIELVADRLSSIQLERLLKMPEYPLFESSGIGQERYWVINFGTDTNGAAFLISRILISIFELSDSSQPHFVTIVENLAADTDDDNRWWVQETSEEYRDRYNRSASKHGYFTRNSDGSQNNGRKD